MPVYLGGAEYVQFNYDPSYLKGYDNLKTNTSKCLPKGMQVITSSLIVDGGNVVSSKRHVVLTDAVYSENKSLSKVEVDRKLQSCFPSKRIIIIPTEPCAVVLSSGLYGHRKT